MALVVEQQVLRLQVAVDDVPLVAMLEGKDGAGDVVPCVLLAPVEALAVVGRVQLAAESRLEQEVQRLGPVVGGVKLDDEGRIRHHEDVLLVHHALLHARLDDEALAQALQGIGVTSGLVLPKLDRAKTTATQQTDAGQVLPLDLAGWRVVHLALDPLASAHGGLLLVSDLEVLQRADQLVEGVAVQGQGLGRRRLDGDRGRPRLAAQQGALAEELRCARGLARGEPRQLLVVLDDTNLALIQDVEGASWLALLEDDLVLREVHLDERLGDCALLLPEQRVEDADPVEVLDVLFDLVVRHLHQNVLEVRPVNDPHHGVGNGLHRSGPGNEVQQSQLAEAAAAVYGAHVLRLAAFHGALGTLRLIALLADKNLEAALLDDVEVVRHQVALGDDLLALGHVLLPKDLHHLLDPGIVEGDHGLQVVVLVEGIDDERPLLVRLRGGRLHLDGPAAAAADGLSVGELQTVI
mmetsp:Transcript_12582/g.36077  ORF Transcript_12582/g.36077 Transcript_12582/m.36077 type:complete len:466 (+) Transcript_12582:864-2261(+)